MFQIKICGVTSIDDALSLAEAGADAVGLNFYPRSPRFLLPDRAFQIADALPIDVVKVGVFVNATVEQMCQTFDRVGLDLIQLHGDEPPEIVGRLANRPVIRAFRLGPLGLEPVMAYLARCREMSTPVRMVLLDAYQKGEYGGTGKVADWTCVAKYPNDGRHPPLVLAGGLSMENVAEAIRAVRPSAVDTASGVESSPGRKDSSKVRSFITSARAAFAG